MNGVERHFSAAKKFLEDAILVYNSGSTYSIPLLCYRAIEHVVMALAWKIDPMKARELGSHRVCAYWLITIVKRGRAPSRLANIFYELSRYASQATYDLEDSGLAKRSLELAREFLEEVKKILGLTSKPIT